MTTGNFWLQALCRPVQYTLQGSLPGRRMGSYKGPDDAAIPQDTAGHTRKQCPERSSNVQNDCSHLAHLKPF